MQGHRGKMVSIPETFDIDNASSSSSTSAAVDEQILHPETLLPNDYMLPPNDSFTFMNPNLVHEQQSLNNGWNFGKSSSSSSAPLGNSEWKSESGWPSSICPRQGPRIDDQFYAPDNNVLSLGAASRSSLCPQVSGSGSPAMTINLGQDHSSARGYVREGSSADNRRTPCKRKSRDDAEVSGWPTHHSSGASGNSSYAPPFTDQVDPRLGLGLPISVETSQRNLRLRVNNSSSGENSLRPQSTTPPVAQSATLPSLELPHPSALQSQVQGALFHAPVPLQLGPWATNSIPRNAILNLDSLTRNEACIPRNFEEHPLFVPPHLELRALAQNSVVTRNVGHSSASSATPQPSHHPRYHRRLFEHIHGQGMSSASLGGQNSSSHPPFPQIALPYGPSNLDHHHRRSALGLERQTNSVVGIPYSMRSGFPSEGRRRLASEIRTVIEMIRRGEALQFEDVMMLDPSMLFGVTDIHDSHRDMRLDVDNMTYEELLALEEHIGNVGTGLNQETISTHMKQHKYTKLVHVETEVEPCCICQEDYNEGEDIGTLDCGHDFHRDCVNQWLMHKNLCPICKTTGLATT